MAAILGSHYRLPPETLAQIDHLAKLWGGPVRPLTRTDVIREAVRRMCKAEAEAEANGKQANRRPR